MIVHDDCAGLIAVVDPVLNDAFAEERVLRRLGIENPIAMLTTASDATAYFRGLADTLAPQVGLLLVMLAARLPDGNGLEVLANLRQDPRFDCVAVVMVSARMAPGDVAQAAKLGAQCFLEKPVQARDLNTVATHAGIYRSGRTGRQCLFEFRRNLLMSCREHSAKPHHTVVHDGASLPLQGSLAAM